jgi:hypothetical protein
VIKSLSGQAALGLSLRLKPGAFAFLPHSLGLKNQSQSNSIKVNQSDSVGQAGGQNRM